MWIQCFYDIILDSNLISFLLIVFEYKNRKNNLGTYGKCRRRSNHREFSFLDQFHVVQFGVNRPQVFEVFHRFDSKL